MSPILKAMVCVTLLAACASGDRRPASKQSRPMNYRNLDTETLFQACLRERPERNCRNRMGR